MGCFCEDFSENWPPLITARYCIWHWLPYHGAGWSLQNTDSTQSILMGQCKNDITPLLTHWKYLFLALTHRYVTWSWHSFCLQMSLHITMLTHFAIRTQVWTKLVSHDYMWFGIMLCWIKAFINSGRWNVSKSSTFISSLFQVVQLFQVCSKPLSESMLNYC